MNIDPALRELIVTSYDMTNREPFRDGIPVLLVDEARRPD